MVFSPHPLVPAPASYPHAQMLRFSAVLRELADDPSRDVIQVADLLDAMRDRAFGALIFVFAVPNALPTPPGTSSVLAIPLLFLAAQMALGQAPWLPRMIAVRAMPRNRFAAIVDTVTPWILRAERLLRPRFPALSGRLAERLIGGFCLVLALVLVMPIPLGNMLPAVALCVLAFGILEKDGLWIGLGLATGLTALALVAGVVYAIVKSAVFLLGTLFLS